MPAQYVADMRAVLDAAAGAGSVGEDVIVSVSGAAAFVVRGVVRRHGAQVPAGIPGEYAGRGEWVSVLVLLDDMPGEIPGTDDALTVDGVPRSIRYVQPAGPQGCALRLYAVGEQYGRRR